MNRNKRVVSFGLWGDSTLYLDGAVRNAREYPRAFPGWTCRFYIGDGHQLAHNGYPERIIKMNEDVVKSLQDAGAEVIRMGISTDVLGMYWRFHAMWDDPTVEVMLSRDTDSLPSRREFDAVNYWLETGKAFHIVRDAEAHNVPVLGGTWGARPEGVPEFKQQMALWFTALRPHYEHPRSIFHGTDQEFLAKHIYPLVKHDHIAHIRAGMAHLRFADTDIELPPLGDHHVAGGDGHYIGMVC